MSGRVGRSVRVTGRVQGVFFRAWTADEARSLGISGWVRNDRDGSVVAQIEGEESAVRQLIELLHEGPPGARVERVDVDEADPEGSDRFEVRH
jgi:acylphosphatase